MGRDEREGVTSVRAWLSSLSLSLSQMHESTRFEAITTTTCSSTNEIYIVPRLAVLGRRFVGHP